jgi:outer membrane lipoprotein SlyB
MNPHAFALSALSAVLLAGCTSTGGRTVYTRSQVNQAMRVELGTVVGVREVVIDGESTNVGVWGGAMMGGAIGGTAASGSSTAIAAAGGSVAGMIAGREIEKAVTRKPGLEITITLDDGTPLVIVQEKEKGGFIDGDRVRVMIGQGTAIVLH